MAYVQRVRDSEVRSSKQDTNITLLPPKDQGSLCKRALEDCKSPQLGMTTTQQCFLDTTEQLHKRTQSSCDSELRIHAMANLPNPSLERERAPEVPPLTEELLSVVGRLQSKWFSPGTQMSPKLGLTQGTLLGWLTFSYSGPQTSVDIRGPDVKFRCQTTCC